jgi:hypothetical protein
MMLKSENGFLSLQRYPTHTLPVNVVSLPLEDA